MIENKDALGKNTRIVLIVVIALSVGIFFWGATDTNVDIPTSDATPHRKTIKSDTVPNVKAYQQLRESPMYAQIRSWIEDEERLKGNTPGYLDDVNNEDASKEDVLKERATNRAFDGAPPTVPHPTIQTESPDCLVCHEKGLQIRGRIASPISHNIMHNCTQCHTTSHRQDPAVEPFLSDDNISWENSFEGRQATIEGRREFTIGPPQIPHTTLMRERCDSCHGLNGSLAIRTPHPDRFNCQQCHVGAAVEDQRVTLDLPPVEK